MELITMYLPVMRLCDKQLRDINPDDVLNDGWYRKCATYKSGGGYDEFAKIASTILSIPQQDLSTQFVVQLRGCPLNCPYCYVTRDGVVNGECKNIEIDDLIDDFRNTKLKVFHLMGGSPALYIEYWLEILHKLNNYVFHSDFLLVEKPYDKNILKQISEYENAVFAVSIKASTDEEFYQNTQTIFNEKLFYSNLDKLVESKIRFYLTFTGMSDTSIIIMKNRLSLRYGEQILNHSFSIPLIHYRALD